MSNSPLVTYTKLSPNCSKPRNHAIDTITIHCMAGNLSVESCGELFAKASTGASSNYGVGSDGRIALYVDEADRSWASSNSANDNRAITIEVANNGGAPSWPVSDKAYTALIDLLVDICKRNGIPELRWKGDKSLVGKVDQQNMTAHRWFANKACPGDYLYSRFGDIAEKVNAKLRGAEESEEEMKVYNWFADMPDWARPSAEKAYKKGLIAADAKSGAVTVYEANLQPLVWMDRLGMLD